MLVILRTNSGMMPVTLSQSFKLDVETHNPSDISQYFSFRFSVALGWLTMANLAFQMRY